MFSNLIRRISGSFLPRNDRPWSEDATSTAPRIGRKRVLSTTEEDASSLASRKRARGDEPMLSPTEEGDASFLTPDAPLAAPTVADTADAQRDASPTADAPKDAQAEKDVKAVTQGVNEVELEDKAEPAPAPTAGVEEEAKEDVPKAVEEKAVDETADADTTAVDALPEQADNVQDTADVSSPSVEPAPITSTPVETAPTPASGTTVEDKAAAIPLPEDTSADAELASSEPQDASAEASIPSSVSPSPVPEVKP